MTSVVFMGTPTSAVPTLEVLARDHDVRAVITRPDRPKGRSGVPAPPAVKLAASTMGISVLQPSDRLELDRDLQSLRPFAVGVVVAYGMILSSDALSAPERGILNVHFSLLPRWRGAAPVARALMAGDEMTGVTIIELDEGLDTGGVLTAQAIDIGTDEDAGALTARLAAIGSRLIGSVLDGYADRALSPIPQSDEGMTYASMLGASDRALDSQMTTVEFLNRVRALSPAPGAHIDLDGIRTRILRAVRSEVVTGPGRWELVDARPVIGVADGAVELLELQPAGKTVMSGPEWGRGRRAPDGSVGP